MVAPAEAPVITSISKRAGVGVQRRNLAALEHLRDQLDAHEGVGVLIVTHHLSVPRRLGDEQRGKAFHQGPQPFTKSRRLGLS